MKRETTIRIARAVWRAGLVLAVGGALPCAALSALGHAQGAAAGLFGALSLAGSFAMAAAGVALGRDF